MVTCMALMSKTWRQKFDNGREPQIEVLEKDFGGMKAGDRMLVSTPRQVDSGIRKIPKGTTTDIPAFRNSLASESGADGACPLSTSIFIRIVSEVALEELANGTPRDEVAPFWRVVDPKSPLAKKLSCGSDAVAKLAAEDSIKR